MSEMTPDIVLFNVRDDVLETVRRAVLKEFDVNACRVFRMDKKSAQVSALERGRKHCTVVLLDADMKEILEDIESYAEYLRNGLCRTVTNHFVIVMREWEADTKREVLGTLNSHNVNAEPIFRPRLTTHGKSLAELEEDIERESTKFREELRVLWKRVYRKGPRTPSELIEKCLEIITPR